MPQLYDFQAESLEELRELMRRGIKRVIMKAPTGAGKTVIAGEIFASARKKGNKALFTVPAIDLVDQTVERFYEAGITDIGVIQADHEMTDWSKPIQIASVQTLQKRAMGGDPSLLNMPEAAVVLVDEIHKWFEFYGRWFLNQAWLAIPIIGLSATPWTKGIKDYFDKDGQPTHGGMITVATTEELIAKGRLSNFRVFAPSHPDLNGVAVSQGDYVQSELEERMGPLTADIVDTWLKRGENRSTLCFCINRAHAKHVQAKFLASGVPTGYQDAFTKKHDSTDKDGVFREGRKRIKQKFHSGEYRVVCNVGTLTTGVDWDVRCLILARPTKSEMLFVQIVGRGLRTAEGKDDCLILDHSDNHLRLGFVTDVDVRNTELLDGKTRTAEPSDRILLPKECPNCSFLKPPRTPKCPVCGFVAVAHNDVEEDAGELRELTRRRRPENWTMDEKRQFYAEALAIACDRGYKPGWASNFYRKQFGVWPVGVKDVVPAEHISASTWRFMEQQNREYARSKAPGRQWHREAAE